MSSNVLLLILLLSLIVVLPLFAKNVSYCQSFRFYSTISETDKTLKPLFKIYEFDFYVNISFNQDNKTFPNNFAISYNNEESLYNSSLYYRVSPIYLVFDKTWGINQKTVNCSTFNETCNISFPNGPIDFHSLFHHINKTLVIGDATNLFINNGFIFDGDKGIIPKQNYTCFAHGGLKDYPLDIETDVCCANFEEFEIPETQYEQCEEFQTIATIIDEDYNTTINFEIMYEIFTVDQSYETINISFHLLNGPNYSYYYGFGSLNDRYCRGTENATNANCTNYIINKLGDLQFEFIFTMMYEKTVPEPLKIPPNYDGVIVGEIIKRNGSFFKNNNQPYTSRDPCWSKSSGVPFTTAKYNSTFCCTKFSKGTPSSTPTPTTPNATPSPNLQANLVGSPCSNDTSLAWLDIVFVVDTSNAMTQRNLNEMSGEIVTYMTGFTFGQNGNHTIRTAIISYATNPLLYYKLSDSTTLDAFTDKLFSLSDYWDPEDDGGNVQRALQQAFNHLQTQKSSRKRLIVLVAAAYNSDGFQGANHTANVVKDDGIEIVVINFQTSDSVLSTALEGIASPGYYYISDQDNLYQNIQYALTQINCFCPPGSKQFRYPNLAWGNYTNYADCLFGFKGYTSPINAQRACKPGILVAITSQEKLDFIADKIVAYEIKGEKKFSIGIHKSSLDNQWKWWNYNETEYAFGNFPIMSQTPDPNDNYGYMWNHYGFNWSLQTGNNIPLPYICQLRACDAEYYCDQTQTKKISFVY